MYLGVKLVEAKYLDHRKLRPSPDLQGLAGRPSGNLDFSAILCHNSILSLPELYLALEKILCIYRRRQEIEEGREGQ